MSISNKQLSAIACFPKKCDFRFVHDYGQTVVIVKETKNSENEFRIYEDGSWFVITPRSAKLFNIPIDNPPGL